MEWKADTDGIVNIRKNKFTAQKAGETVLTTTVEGFNYELRVFVEDPVITTGGIVRKGNKYTLGMKADTTAQLAFAKLCQQTVFKSSDCSVAYADEDGVIHARAKGKAKLVGRINGKAITIVVKVD